MLRYIKASAYATEFARKYWYIFLGSAIILVTILISPLCFTFISTKGERYDLHTANINNIPFNDVAIVFGAGVHEDGSPTPYLKNRVETAVRLYKANRANKILMTADNSRTKYNEPVAMQKYAQKLGVPKQDIVLDYAGFNTYDSCYRAGHIFNIKQAILVTQGYHLPRAMVTCSGLGVNNVGVAAVHKSRDFTISYILREFISTDKMTFQLIFKPKPTVLGNPEKL